MLCSLCCCPKNRDENERIISMLISHLTRWEEESIQPALAVWLSQRPFFLSVSSSGCPTPPSGRVGVQTITSLQEFQAMGIYGESRSEAGSYLLWTKAKYTCASNLELEVEGIPNGNITLLSAVNPLPPLSFVYITVALKTSWAPSGIFKQCIYVWKEESA